MFFVKMQGVGNDYIFVPCYDRTVENMGALAIEMSDRHFGVGGDGVVYLYPSTVADVKMRMFNSDGSEGAMCGNAVRCIARLVSQSTGKERITVETNVGIKTVVKDGELFTVNMGKPHVERAEMTIFGIRIEYFYVDMGNPHCVIFTDDLDVSDDYARAVQGKHSGGINVEFVKKVGNKLVARVFERGSGETLSCGTGACACVAAAVFTEMIVRGERTAVELKGGTLYVNYNDDIFLTGNAEKVYEGEYYDKVHFCDRRSCKRTR